MPCAGALLRSRLGASDGLQQLATCGRVGPALPAPGAGSVGRRRAARRTTLVPVQAGLFDSISEFNLNPLDYLKVPRHQTAMTLYPWMEAQYRRERMRLWLQSELCMSEAQARSVLSRCPALSELDVRLAQRRLRQLDSEMHISRGEAALLVLRHPQQLLPQVSDVVDFAVQHRKLGRRAGPPRDS